jgi:hypothetical protein
MSIQHVINWIEGAPGTVKAGMIRLYSDGSYCLTGTDDEEKVCANAIKHAQLIHGYDLDWAASMGIKRELAL